MLRAAACGACIFKIVGLSIRHRLSIRVAPVAATAACLAAAAAAATGLQPPPVALEREPDPDPDPETPPQEPRPLGQKQKSVSFSDGPDVAVVVPAVPQAWGEASSTDSGSPKSALAGVSSRLCETQSVDNIHSPDAGPSPEEGPSPDEAVSPDDPESPDASATAAATEDTASLDEPGVFCPDVPLARGREIDLCSETAPCHTVCRSVVSARVTPKRSVGNSCAQCPTQ